MSNSFRTSLVYMQRLSLISYQTLGSSITTAADAILNFFFGENGSWCFLWVVCLADDSDEILRRVFSLQTYKGLIKCRLLQVLLGA